MEDPQLGVPFFPGPDGQPVTNVRTSQVEWYNRQARGPG
jgi:hypothetical protein